MLNRGRFGVDAPCDRSIRYNLSHCLHVALAPRDHGADCDLKLASDVTLPFCTNLGEHAHAPQVPLFDVMLPVERAAPGTDNI